MLGDTLTLIAGEKAGIFKSGVPAITMPQEEEAMAALVVPAPSPLPNNGSTGSLLRLLVSPLTGRCTSLSSSPQAHAARVGIPLHSAPALESFAPGVPIGLEGEHQRANAAVAVALCNSWLTRREATAAASDAIPVQVMAPSRRLAVSPATRRSVWLCPPGGMVRWLARLTAVRPVATARRPQQSSS